MVLFAASIALVLTSALFVVNRFYVFMVSHKTATAYRTLTVSNGALWYNWIPMSAPTGGEGWNGAVKKRPSHGDFDFGPIRWWPQRQHLPFHLLIAIPLWMFALPSAVLAAWTLFSLRRKPGHCECGYTLVGLPAQAPCPECGRAAVGAKQ